MDYNPYAAPDARLAAAAPGPDYGQPQPWNAGEALSLAWARFKDNWPVLVFSYVLATVIGAAAGQVPTALTLARSMEPTSGIAIALRASSTAVGQLVGAFFHVGLIRIWLDVARGSTPSFAALFSGGDRFLPMLGLSLLTLLAVLGGLALLVVPGVILWLGLFAAPFYVVDANMGPLEAMKASWSATRGQKAEVFVLTLGGAGLGLLGLLMCCVGVAATLPIYSVATAIAFTRVSGRSVAMQASSTS